MIKYHILVVDDDKNRCKMLDYKLKKSGYKVTYTTSPGKALDIFSAENIDVVVSDIRMGEMTGIELLRELKTIDPLINVILITAYGKDSELLLEALRGGAFEFLEKIEDIDLLNSIIEKAIKDRQVKINFNYYKDKYDVDEKPMFLGEHQSVKEIKSMIMNIAPTDSTVLITGESGTGKEIVAKMIYKYSNRKNASFVSVNCAAINENLLESELFGHKKGSFTGAYTNKDGLFKVANEGTIFLDEIAEMDTSMQVKLLRVIQEKEITPIGSVETIPVDVRIIAATNKDIEKEVENNRFRTDLFYRLNVIRLDIPPIRERKSDIRMLFDYYIEQFAAKYSKSIEKISDDVYRKLEHYDWPGNVRELINIAERMIVIKQDSKIAASDIPVDIGTNKFNEEITSEEIPTIEGMERNLIERALERASGDKKEAAEKLGIDLSTLYRKLKSYENKE